MRGIGSLHPTEGIPVPADIVALLAISSALGAAAQDYPSQSATGSSRPHLMRLSANVGFYFRDGSTSASVPSSTSSTPGSTVNGSYIDRERWYQVPAGSTGYSVAGLSSGVVTIEFFRKGGDST